MVVFEQAEDAEGLGALGLWDSVVALEAYLGVACVLRGIVEESGCMVVLVPRSCDAAAERGRLGVADVLMGFGEMRRLHSVCARGCASACSSVVVVGRKQSRDSGGAACSGEHHPLAGMSAAITQLASH